MAGEMQRPVEPSYLLAVVVQYPCWVQSKVGVAAAKDDSFKIKKELGVRLSEQNRPYWTFS